MSPWKRLLGLLPRGYTLSDADWSHRHRLLLWVLAAHAPALLVIGLLTGHGPVKALLVALPPAIAVAAGHVLRAHRRASSVTVTGGLVYCSVALVGLTHGTTEAHFHFFIIIGFIALYQDWAPFLFNIVFTVVSHGIGSAWQRNLIFDHADAQADPWTWSLVHGVAVLLACVGMMLFWRVTEDSQREQERLTRQLADTEIGRRQFTSDLLTNLARRNQSLLYRQLQIINQLEESERDPDALAELFALDHLATRVRRNAESLLVLSGEKPPRTWSSPVALRDVLRAAVAETEDLERVTIVVDERAAVLGHVVTDLTHLVAELTENAVRFSPPDTGVVVRGRPDRTRPGAMVITVEDTGVGMPREALDIADALLAAPPDIDLSVSQRLGFHVIARLAARQGIDVSLRPTPGSGVTAVLLVPASLFAPHGVATREVRPPANARPAVAERTLVSSPRAAGPAPAPRPLIPSPSPSPVPSPAPAPGVPRAAWNNWWAAPEGTEADSGGDGPAPGPTADPPPPPDAGRPAVAPTASAHPPGPHTTRGGLRRRVPQSHLSEELRHPVRPSAPGEPGRAARTPDAARALSRYQASRAAAQSAAEDHDR